jgi:UDP-N-acetylglucosamine 2-epimerase (non-hydrolysing)
MSGKLELALGARPNFVKGAALWRAIEARAPGSLAIVHTGQHHTPELADAFARELGLPEPVARLGAGAHGTHARQTADILVRYEMHLAAHSPRAVIVVGDVNSTLACALAAAKLGIPVVHVEAGLRSFDRTMPEELNRVLVDAMSDLLLASEPSGVEHLRREGIAGANVRLVGSLSVDTLVHELERARAVAPIDLERYAFATLHRPSNVDDPVRLDAIVGALEATAREIPVVLSVHPRTAARLEEAALVDRLQRCVKLVGPLLYEDALALMLRAAVVVTDSGGMQEETTYLGIPCLTLRTTTERPITVERGTNVLVGEDVSRLSELVRDAAARPRERTAIETWDGRAAARAAEAILDRYA